MEAGHARVSKDKVAQLEDANDKLTRQNVSQADTLSKMQAEGAKQAARIKALEDELAITKKLAARSEKVGRIRSERDDLRREVVRLRNERVGLGHRYINWGIRKNLVSDTRNADLSVRAWLHEEGILDDPRSVSQWQATTGFTLIPNEVDPTSIPFTLPCGSECQPPRSDSDDDVEDPKSSAPKTSEAKPAEATPKSAKPPMSSVKSPENKSSSKKTESRCKNKRDEAGSSTSKTSPRDPKKPRTSASDPIEVDIDEDPDDHAIRKKGETSDHNELLDLHWTIQGQKPWIRFGWCGSFLPDVDGQHQHVRHAASVRLFQGWLSQVWEHTGETLWNRLFFVKTKTSAWDNAGYHWVRLVFELCCLIENSDFTDDLIRFHCIPHPAWPNVIKDPINLEAIRSAHGKDVALNYLTEQHAKFWPEVPSFARTKNGSVQDWSCPLGSLFEMAAHKNPRHTDRSAKLYWRRLQLYQGEEPDQEAMSPVDELFEVVEEKLRRAGQMASDFIRSGAVFPEDKVLPFVSVELPSDKGNRPDQWFHGIPPPKTMFMWEGEPNASFWKVTPQMSAAPKPQADEDDQFEETKPGPDQEDQSSDYSPE
ncbi:unnamed protein product [Aphanomyces euteiches]